MKLLRSRYRVVYAALVLLALLFVLQVAGPLKPVTHAMGRALAPVARGMTRLGDAISNTTTFLRRIGGLARENSALEEENQRVRAQNAALQELAVENDALRAQLKLAKRSAYTLVATVVIGRAPEGTRQTLLVNRGTADGVRSGLAVLSPTGLFVGTIVDAQEHQATVLLVVDQASRVAALVQPSRATGTLRGELGLGLTLETIPLPANVRTGDTVVTSGLGGTLPRGLVIGTITALAPAANALFQQAAIRPAVTFHTLEHVFVITRF